MSQSVIDHNSNTLANAGTGESAEKQKQPSYPQAKISRTIVLNS